MAEHLISFDHLRHALREVGDRLLTPALIVDLAAVEHNVDAMLARIDNPRRWRPHIKTVKQSAVLEILLAKGIRDFKCATLDELGLLLRTAARAKLAESIDVVLAYPAIGPMARAFLALRLAWPRTRMQLLADSPEHLDELAALATSHACSLDVLLDVDVGMHRTGSSVTTWSRWLERDASLPGVSVRGIHGYDGHLAWDERAVAHTAYASLCALFERLPPSVDRRVIITSGTMSYAHALTYGGWRSELHDHQVSPGTIVLSDLRSAPAAIDLGLQQAVFVATRVVSHPREGHVTLDAGSKAICPDRPAPGCVVAGWSQLEALAPSEEHLPVRSRDGVTPALGTLLFLIPDHACTTVNMYRRAVLVHGARFVGTGAIEASGHPLWEDEVS